jgi:hypothetical protein
LTLIPDGSPQGKHEPGCNEQCRGASVDAEGGCDIETLTEVLWAALHGLVTLHSTDRVRPGQDTDRIELLIAQFSTTLSATPSAQT